MTPQPPSQAEDARTEGILLRMLILLATLLFAVTLIGHFNDQNHAQQLVVRYGLIAVTLAALALLRTRGSTAAMRLLLRGFLIVVFGHILLFGGLRTPAMIALPALLLMSAWFLGRKESLLLAIAGGLAVSVGAWLETIGVVTPLPRRMTDHLFAIAIAIPVSTLMGLYLLNRFQNQIDRANESARRLERELATRALVERDLQERNDDFRLIHQLSARVHRLRNMDSILREAMGAIVDVTGSRQVTTYLLEPDGKHMRMVASHGFDADFERAAARYPLVGSWSIRAFDEDRPLVTTDVGAEPHYTPAIRTALLAHGVRGAILLPLTDQGAPLGCTAIFFPAGVVDRFTAAQMEGFEAVARTLAMAVANVRYLEHLLDQARRDALTGLANRTRLHETFKELEMRIAAGARPAMMLLDLDRFKEINDTLGHHVGDTLLIAIASRLEQSVKDADALTCRLGGDEFAVLLPDVESTDEALRRADLLRSALAAPFDIGGMSLKVGASLGLAVYPDHGADSHQLLRAADVAMYRSKTHALGVSLYDRLADTHSTDKLGLMAELSDAFARNELLLHFQPKLDLASGTIDGVEALVRWQHPRLGLLPPTAFVPLAETGEIIHVLTRAVLELAIRARVALRDAGLPQRVAVNLSARNLVDDRCVQEIEQALALHGLPGEGLEVEITETAIMHDPDQVALLLDRLDRRGIALTLDDFGTGFSSLENLKRLPLDFLKIDRAFIRDMTRDEHDAIIVRSTITLAHNLGKRVIAEGVEDPRAEAMLRDMGCDSIQGFLLARPMPLDVLIDWLGSWHREPVAAGGGHRP